MLHAKQTVICGTLLYTENNSVFSSTPKMTFVDS